MAILASYVNEQILYHYIRWLIHRPGLALGENDSHFAPCLQTSTEAAAAILRTAALYQHVVPFIKMNPAAHPCTAFIAALTPLYRTKLLKSHPTVIPMLGYSAEDDLKACQNGLTALAFSSHDHSDVVRRRVLHDLVSNVFGDEHEECKRLSSLL